MLLSFIFVWKEIWYFRQTETYENYRKHDLFCPFHKFLWDENFFFNAVLVLWNSCGEKFFPEKLSMLNYFLTYFFWWRLRSISDTLSNIYDGFFFFAKKIKASNTPLWSLIGSFIRIWSLGHKKLPFFGALPLKRWLKWYPLYKIIQKSKVSILV